MNIDLKQIKFYVIVGLLASLLSVIFTYLRTPKYTTSLSFLVASPETKTLTIGSSQTPQTVLAAFLKNRTLLRNVSIQTGVEEEQLYNGFFVETSIGGGTVELSVESSTPSKDQQTLASFAVELRKLQARIADQKKTDQFDYLRKALSQVRGNVLEKEKSLFEISRKKNATIDTKALSEIISKKNEAVIKLASIKQRRVVYLGNIEKAIDLEFINAFKNQIIETEAELETVRNTTGPQAPELLTYEASSKNFKQAFSKLKNSVVAGTLSGSSQELITILITEAELKETIKQYEMLIESASKNSDRVSGLLIDLNAEKEKFSALQKEILLGGVNAQRNLVEWTVIDKPITLKKPTNKKFLLTACISFVCSIVVLLTWQIGGNFRGKRFGASE
jgi:capsule polysaccharide export protein KpsE/RkpR